MRVLRIIVGTGTFLCILAWLVNVEVAVKYSSNLEHFVLDRVLPSLAYAPLEAIAVDMSTVSTLLPALLLVFVLSALTKLPISEITLPWWMDEDAAPFPAYFPSFCFWCGLGGTLYGMMLGLPDKPAAGAPIPIQEALATLIVGFKTAVVSTMVGMVMAGTSFAVSGLFRRFLVERVPPPSLVGSVEELRREIEEFKGAVLATITPFSQLQELALLLSRTFSKSANQLERIQETIGSTWFETVLRHLADQNALGISQAGAIDRIHSFLEQAHGDAAPQHERDRVADDRHREMVRVVSEVTERQLAERERFSHGLWEGLSDLANRLEPSKNGSPRKGVTR